MRIQTAVHLLSSTAGPAPYLEGNESTKDGGPESDSRERGTEILIDQAELQ